MKVLIGSDHAGYDLKQDIIEFVRDELGHDIEDVGTHSRESCDYPNYAQRVAVGVAGGQANLGILICGTGIGMSLAANRVPGILASCCHDTYSARMARAHNALNVLCLGERVMGVEIARDVTREFLSVEVDQDERHARRRALTCALGEQHRQSA